jgi:hypothetical protein
VRAGLLALTPASTPLFFLGTAIAGFGYGGVKRR